MAYINSSQGGGPGATLREWSSLIGIVTAIVGNIFISFALNIQRYAHIRLGREQDEQKEQWIDVHNGSTHNDYGTQQRNVAEQRARLNLTGPKDGDSPQDLLSSGQNTPSKLVRPQASSVSMHSHSSSDSTIKPSEKTEPSANKKSYLQSPYWWGGIVLMTVGEAGNFLAYGFAPASIVSPLGVVALVSNCIIAPCLLKERFRQRDFWGVMTAIAGAVVIVLSAKNSENKMGPDDVWRAITRWEFELYLGITAGLMIILIWASGKYGERTILIDLGLVGLFGGYTALSTKGVASLLSDTLWRTLTFPVTYLLVFILVATALMQIRYVNRALQRFDSTQVIPIQFVLFTISVIVGSAILYRDFRSATGDRIGKFIAGCLLTFFGVYLITSGRTKGGDEDDGPSLDDEENAIGLVDEEGYQDEMQADRKNSHQSVTYENADRVAEPRRSSKQSGGTIEPAHRTPSRTPSNVSSASSRLSKATESSLLANPWKPATSNTPPNRRPHAVESSISSPLLPSESHVQGSSRLQRTTPGRPSNLSRRSMVRLTPGLLMSPLSSSLSAVVADERRRAADGGSLRRRPEISGPRKRSSKNTAALESAFGSSPPNASQLPEQAVEEDRPIPAGRSKSIGGALGGLFRFNREKSKDKSNDQDNGSTE